MIIGVDHILVAVKSVEQALEDYRRLGFQAMQGGEHPRTGTYNALVPLSDGSYFELIGVKDRAKAENSPTVSHVIRALGRQSRLATFALVSNDLPTDLEALRARGLQIGDPVDGERMRPDGQRVAWRSAHFQEPNLPFLIEDITPHHVRVPAPEQGLGARTWLSQVHVLAHDVADASRVWKDLLGVIPSRDDEFRLERCLIQLLPNNGQPTGISHVTLATDDLQDAARKLESGGLKVSPTEGVIELDPGTTAGASITIVRSG